MAFHIDDGCPRCGMALEKFASTSKVRCLGIACGNSWKDIKAVEREALARDLEGTRAVKQVGKKYLTRDGENGKSFLGDMQEVVDLVRLVALQEVIRGIEDAIEGRNSQVDSIEKLLSFTDRNPERKRLIIEIDVLTKMRDWVLAETAPYSNPPSAPSSSAPE